METTRLAKDEIGRLLSAATKGKRVMTAGVPKRAEWLRGPDPAGIVGNHAYSILGYDAVRDRVTMRNPWGHQELGVRGAPRDGVDDGVFEVSLEEFKRHWSHFTVESAE